MTRKILSMLVAFILVISSLTTVAFGANQGTVLYDKGGIKITYQSYEVTKYGDFDIKLLIENNSAQNICVQVRNESVNGYMADGIMSDDVSAGQKVNGELTYADYTFEENYISAIYDVEFSFHIFNDESWDTIDDSAIVKLSFGGVNINNGISADTRPVTNFFNEGGFKVSFIDCAFDDEGDLNVNFLIENNTAMHLCVQARDESINGFMIDSIMSEEVMPGKRIYGDMTFKEYVLKENGISSINEINFSMDIFDSDTYDTLYETQIYKIVNGGVQGYTQGQNPASQSTQTPASGSSTNEIKVVVNGNQVYFDQPPVAENGRTLVPLRAIFESLGATVGWDGATQTITSQRGSTVITLRLGSNEMYVSGSVKMLDVPAKAINGRTLVPVRAISEAYGCNVTWDGNTQTVYITQ